MILLAMTTQELIEAAFADATYPGDDNIAEHQNCPECDDVRAYFRGKAWRDLKFPELHQFHESLPLLTPQAFRYFLPGYMTAVLDNWEQADMIPYSIIQIGGYQDEAWNVREETKENRKIFSGKQREAIAAWLRELYQFDSFFWPDEKAMEYTVRQILED
jgi:hypothetical protein